MDALVDAAVMAVADHGHGVPPARQRRSQPDARGDPAADAPPVWGAAVVDDVAVRAVDNDPTRFRPCTHAGPIRLLSRCVATPRGCGLRLYVETTAERARWEHGRDGDCDHDDHNRVYAACLDTETAGDRGWKIWLSPQEGAWDGLRDAAGRPAACRPLRRLHSAFPYGIGQGAEVLAA